MDSPVGRMIVVAENDALTRLEFSGRPHARGIPEEASVGSLLLNEVKRQLETYFSGALSAFDLPLLLQGTPFQQRVWQALLDIPFGATSSYSCLAAQIDRPAAVRAVGAANGLNPISIIVPCHRLIGANGHLTGYAGGQAAKRWLLRHEGHRVEGNAEDKIWCETFYMTTRHRLFYACQSGGLCEILGGHRRLHIYRN